MRHAIAELKNLQGNVICTGNEVMCCVVLSVTFESETEPQLFLTCS